VTLFDVILKARTFSVADRLLFDEIGRTSAEFRAVHQGHALPVLAFVDRHSLPPRMWKPRPTTGVRSRRLSRGRVTRAHSIGEARVRRSQIRFGNCRFRLLQLGKSRNSRSLERTILGRPVSVARPLMAWQHSGRGSQMAASPTREVASVSILSLPIRSHSKKPHAPPHAQHPFRL